MNKKNLSLKNIINNFLFGSWEIRDKVSIIYSEDNLKCELTYNEFLKQTIKIINFLKLKLGSSKLIVIDSRKHKYTYPLILASLIIGIPFVAIDDKDENSSFRLKSSIKNLKNTFYVDSKKISEINSINFKNIDLLSSLIDENNKTNISQDAYIMFTSGSTGEPKGVCIKRESFALYINWIQSKYKNNSLPHFHLSMSPIHFDNSIHDLAMFICLHSLITINDIYEFKNLFGIYENSLKVNSIYGTPSLIKKLKLSGLIKKISLKQNLRFIGFGGEGYSWDELEYLSKELKDNIFFHNYYGPTEGTCMCSCFSFNSDNTSSLKDLYSQYSNCPPLGEIFQYFNFEIIDDELIIFGNGLMRGYIKPTLNPDLSYEIKGSIDKYKTGDICKYRSNQIFINGRKDNQIKINGIRLEIEEVEYRINSLLKETKSCLFVVDDRFKFLAAVIEKNEFVNSFKSSENSLGKYLRKNLPNFMVPADFILTRSLPTNRSGKIDRISCKNMYFSLRNQ